MTKRAKNSSRRVRVALVVPHIFINREIMPGVIFSPGWLALDLAAGLLECGVEVTLCTPGEAAVRTVDGASGAVRTVTADMSGFERELAGRGYGYLELLRKHPATFVAMARQVQAELIADVYERANAEEFDVVHVYTNEEDIAMQFARFCRVPVCFTHHDPFNFLIKYKSVMPKYRGLNWVSVSMAQRRGMPEGTNWVGNIYHGVEAGRYGPRFEGGSDYFAYVGRIIEAKGVHLAIAAVREYNAGATRKMKLRIAGKHYGDGGKDAYWREVVEPALGDGVEYVGFLQGEELNGLLAGAEALLVPSVFEEPFGMVSLEALACGTPVVGLSFGASAEIVEEGRTGFIVRGETEQEQVAGMVAALGKVSGVDRRACREAVMAQFSLRKMVAEHAELYRRLVMRGEESGRRSKLR